MKIAHDYSHKRYRAVCSDLTRKERKHLGGTSKCMLEIAVLNAFVPIKKFTITAAKLAKGNAQGHGLRLRQREQEAPRPRRREVGRRRVPPRPPERLAPQALAGIAEEPRRRRRSARREARDERPRTPSLYFHDRDACWRGERTGLVSEHAGLLLHAPPGELDGLAEAAAVEDEPLAAVAARVESRERRR